jgi:hypothetical protein
LEVTRVGGDGVLIVESNQELYAATSVVMRVGDGGGPELSRLRLATVLIEVSR